MAGEILKSPEIWHRNDFAVLCNWRKLWRAAEVGVDKGEFSQAFMSMWQGTAFLGVDNYQPYHGMPWDREADFRIACMRYERYARIAKLVRADARELARSLCNSDRDLYAGGLFQFVYIDGCHKYESVVDDLQAWWPLVEQGGIFAGHDFDHEHRGVVEAVTQFADLYNLTVYTTQDFPASWYAYKGGIPGPDWVRNPCP